MEILRCEEKDLDLVTAFYDRVTEYLAVHINYPKWIPGSYPGQESIAAAIQMGTQYAAWEGDQIAGAFVLNDDPQGAYEKGLWQTELHKGDYLVIHAFATDPARSRQGIGRKMVEGCIRIAREQGYPALRLDVVPDNLPARRLYEAMGFAFAGERDLERGIPEIPRFALYEFQIVNVERGKEISC